MVLLNNVVGLVWLELDPSPLCIYIGEFTELSLPEADELIVFVLEIDEYLRLVSVFAQLFRSLARKDRIVILG